MSDPGVGLEGAETPRHGYGPLWEPQASVPVEPPKLLPGPAAWSYAKRYVTFLITTLLGLPVLVFGSYQAEAVRGPVVSSGIIWLLFWLALAYRAQYLGFRATQREAAAGYTTKFDEYRHQLWHLDPKTGEVLRRPGEADERPRRERQITPK